MKGLKISLFLLIYVEIIKKMLITSFDLLIYEKYKMIDGVMAHWM